MAGMVLTNALLVVSLVLLGNSGTAVARPARHEEYVPTEGGDMASVGSTRREVRAPTVQEYAAEVEDLLFANATPKKTLSKQKNSSGKTKEGGSYHAYGSDADGEKGYLKKTYGKGDQGYKSHDTYHKQKGDSYGFEAEEAFGKVADEVAAKQHGKAQKKKQSNDHEGAGTDFEETYAGEYGGGSGEYYSGGDGDSSNYSDGGSSGYSESHSSGNGGDGSGEYYSSGESYY